MLTFCFHDITLSHSAAVLGRGLGFSVYISESDYICRNPFQFPTPNLTLHMVLTFRNTEVSKQSRADVTMNPQQSAITIPTQSPTPPIQSSPVLQKHHLNGKEKRLFKRSA